MKVLLLENVLHIWKAWEIKDVKPGFAANMLFPKKLAVEFTKEEEKKYKQKLQSQERHRRELIEKKHEIIEKLNNQKFEFELKWNKESWKVFWWVWEKDLIQSIYKKFKIQLTKKNIYLPDWHLKKVWEHTVFVKITEKEMAKIFVILKIKD